MKGPETREEQDGERGRQSKTTIPRHVYFIIFRLCFAGALDTDGDHAMMSDTTSPSSSLFPGSIRPNTYILIDIMTLSFHPKTCISREHRFSQE